MASDLCPVPTVEDLRQKYGVTKKEAAILAVLLDGKTHSNADLLASALRIRFGSAGLVPMHIYRMRRKLRPLGLLIDTIGMGTKARGWKLFNVRAS